MHRPREGSPLSTRLRIRPFSAAPRSFCPGLADDAPALAANAAAALPQTPPTMSVSDIPTLQGELARLRPATPADASRLAEVLAHPEVSLWWGQHDAKWVRNEVIGADDGTVAFAIEADGEVVGLITYLEENDPDYRHAAIDIFLDPSRHGRGLGADAVRTVARHLFVDRAHHRLSIDPAAHNERAIRCYGRVGFRPVGVMRRYERGPDGSWHDGLLMDLLAEELT